MTKSELIAALKNEETQKLITTFSAPFSDGLDDIYREAMAQILEEHIVPKIEEFARSKNMVTVAQRHKRQFRNDRTLFHIAVRKEQWEKLGIYFMVQAHWYTEDEGGAVPLNIWIAPCITYGMYTRNPSVVISEQVRKDVKSALKDKLPFDTDSDARWVFKSKEKNEDDICTENVEKLVAFFTEKIDLFSSALDGLEDL